MITRTFIIFTHLWHNRMATHVGETNLKWSQHLMYEYFPPWEKNLADLNQVRKISSFCSCWYRSARLMFPKSSLDLFLSLPRFPLSFFILDFQGCRIIILYYSLLHYVKFTIQDKFLVSGIALVYFNLRAIPG